MNLGKAMSEHAASMKNPPKGYGSINKGMEVAAYRAKREAHYKAKGKDWREAYRLAERDTVKKYGKPF